jgi:hypothetical protein
VTIKDPTPEEIRAALHRAARHSHERFVDLILEIALREIQSEERYREKCGIRKQSAIEKHARRIVAAVNDLQTGETESDRQSANLRLGQLIAQNEDKVKRARFAKKKAKKERKEKVDARQEAFKNMLIQVETAHPGARPADLARWANERLSWRLRYSEKSKYPREILDAVRRKSPAC